MFGFPPATVDPARPFSYLHFGLVVLASILVLAARQPSMLLAPQLVLEDGKIFFAQAYNLAMVDALLQRYSGYWHLTPRLIAEAGSVLPLASVPLFYHLCALTITGLAAAWFYLPHFRHLVANDWVRLAFVVLVVCMPAPDGLMLIAYLQWYIALWAVLLVVMTLPRRVWMQWVLALLYVVALGTAPVLVVLLPVWVLRFFCARGARQRVWLGVVTICSMIMAVIVYIVSRESSGQGAELRVLMLDFVRGVAYKTFATSLLGQPLSDAVIAQFGWSTLVAFAAVAALGLLLLVLRMPARGPSLVLIFIGAAATILYLNRAAYYNFMFANAVSGVPFVGARYFLIGVIVLYLLLVIQADRVLRQSPSAGRWLTMAFGLLLLLYVPTFRLGDWPDAHWATLARLVSGFVAPDGIRRSADLPVAALPLDTDPRYPVLDNAVSNTPRPSYLADTFPVSVPISPPDWNMTLFFPIAQPTVHTFGEGVRLLGVDQRHVGDQLHVALFWQGVPDVKPGDASAYTAFVHVLDAQGQRLAGYDTLLASTAPARQPEDLFVSEHPIQLPPGLQPGVYSLAVGLYHFVGGEPVPGSSVVIADAVTVPP